nr:ABC transporter ATP-binding protein [Dethiosulfovibrio faecalis]
MEDVKKGQNLSVKKVTVLGGKDKNGVPEDVRLEMKAGEIVCIVGPTGSGKSRLLADIEWMAQGDTPTGRRILIDDEKPLRKWRFSLEHKLVAQLSQNMNFVMDLSVREFVSMHAESRMVPDRRERVRTVIEQANVLAGESFSPDIPVTALSGGQSRALMIADTAFLSSSPIVLIDEIENAGINRKRAMDLLVRRDKIVLVATHDPLLALMGSQRISIRNGGIDKILQTSKEENEHMKTLEKLDGFLNRCREVLRNGESLEVLPDFSL